MKLVAEQVKYLRERKAELLKKKDEYAEYVRSREKTSIDGVGMPLYGDYQDEVSFHNSFSELDKIDETLKTSEFVTDRNFEVIDIGTAFSVRFDDDFDDVDKILLVDSGISTTHLHFASLDSDLGRAVVGKTAGDSVSYEVTATGRKLSISIQEIDNIRENYEHFICERPSTTRMSDVYAKKLRTLKETDSNEYNRCFYLSESQRELVEEELNKINDHSRKASDISRKGYLRKILTLPVTLPPMDDTIGVGSKVCVLLTNEDGITVEKNFEFINRAVSTELESHYVEAISPFGVAIAGLKANDTFNIKRKNKPSIKGIVVSVENGKSNLNKRVL